MNKSMISYTKELVPGLVSFIKERMKTSGTKNGILTGIGAIDEVTEGIKPGQVITIVDEPSCRMTLFAQLIEIISVKETTPGLVYTTRIPVKRMALYLLSIFSKVPFIKLARGFCKKNDLNAIHEILSKFYESELYFQFNPIANLKILKNDILNHIQSYNIKIIFFENLSSLMRNENDEHELFILLNKIKDFARKYDITIITNFIPQEKQLNKKVLTVLELESDISLNLVKKNVLKNHLFIEYRLKAINESLCLHNESYIHFSLLERKFIRDNRLFVVSQKDINELDKLERIRYLLNNLFSCFTLWETCMDDEQKQDIADLYHSLLTELKNEPDITSLLDSYPSLNNLKSEIELCLETVQKLYTKIHLFNISPKEIKEIQTILNKYQDSIYEKIAEKMIDDEIEDELQSEL